MKKLNGIIKSFQKTISKLDKLIESNAKETEINKSTIKTIEERIVDIEAERMKAEKIKSNISKFIEE